MYENIANEINENVLNQFQSNSMNINIGFILLLYIVIYMITFVIIKLLKPKFLIGQVDNKLNLYKLVGISIIISLFITILVYFMYTKIYS
jgi:hypothetical protein